MDIDFRYGETSGRVSVSCVPNDDPTALGKTTSDRGLPVCTATVHSTGQGYWALLGWVQLVRYPGNASQGREFEMDPFDLFADSPAPYCWYGITPTLFDAPSRLDTRPMNWTAHSFLAVTPWDQDQRLVAPLAGFSWGYSVNDDGDVRLTPPNRLTGADWATHNAYLIRQYPHWTFDDGSTLG